MATLITFMNSMPGRLLRIVLGVILIVYGLFGLKHTGGMVLALVGLVPLVLGVSGRCLLEPLGPKAR